MKSGYIFITLLLLAVMFLPVSCGGPAPDGDAVKAAIVDQLYLREPNPAFITKATRLMEAAGFKVDLWQGADITVDFYRRLPSLGYRFIVFRVHSGMLLEEVNGEFVEMENTYFFTAENYTQARYVTDQLTDKVSYAIMDEYSPQIFAVNSQFFRAAKGKLENTVVLAMGCESYKYNDLCRVFIDKGASVYIGWNDVVTLEQVDKVTLDLLEKFFNDNMTVAQGIAGTMNDIGRDPYFNSFLKYYPENSGRLTVKELIE